MIAIKQMGQAVLPYLNINRVVTGYTLCQSGTNYLKFTPANYKLLDRIQTVFMAIDFAIAGTSLLLSLLKFEYVQSAFLIDFRLGAIIVGIAFGAGILFSLAVVSKLNKYVDTKRDAQHFFEIPNNPNLAIQHSRSNWYEGLQVTLVARIIVTVSLTLLGMQTPLLCAISIAGLSYSFYKQSCRKWINCTRTFNCPTGIPNGIAQNNQIIPFNQLFKTFKLNYFFPLVEIQNPDQIKDVCPICFEGNEEDEDKPEVYFCESPKHIYHIRCLPGWLTNNGAGLAQHLQVKNRTLQTKNGKADIVTYNIDLPDSKLASCPSCRQDPISQELYFSLQENLGFKINGYPTGLYSQGKINIIKTVKN